MKSTFFTLFSFLSLIVAAFAVPAPVQKRADPTDLVTSLFTQVQAQTAIINSTTAGLTADSTAADNSTATDTINAALASINAAIVSTTTQVGALGAAKRAIFARQDASALATLVENLILEISGALNNIIATLGLTTLLAGLGPLVGSLSGLLLSLEAVVNNLLAVVQALLDGLLTGLSLGLAGLTL